MPRFSYTAIDARGTEKSGLLDAPDTKQVAALLRQQGLFPTAVLPQSVPQDTAPGTNIGPAAQPQRRLRD